MSRKKLGITLLIAGLLMIVFSPDLALEWTSYIDYRSDERYLLDYVIRSFIFISIGFTGLIVGSFLLIFKGNNRN
ncbi:hypothetical protein ACFFJY_02815 [Fictibacillus aquaticus]|uniref:Uncharacterized protein n=1 Tax=Fictibacillus aquaticus TaxID=2021314 RepID=A0A235F8Q7_9BACL|nr:hypothetical protein [Fictibacillus aquaticus]OYD57632.1 hypothetical protein CGZ90_13280 [Fictibacillus aquaticus]